MGIPGTDPTAPADALIVGSGFGGLAATAPARTLTTAYGAPSAPLRRLEIGGRPVWLLARHGEPHAIPPHRINYRANLKALELAGARRIVAVNTVGAVHPQHAPGELAVPRQLIDYTYGRDHSIFDGESATLDHIDFTEPFCGRLRERLLTAAATAGVPCHDGGTYAVTQGPRLETAAEVDRLERDGADFIGMTAMPEAALARELGMRYACLSLIVNQAAGRGEREIHEDIEATTARARERAMRVLSAFFASTANAAEPA
ncbi:MAG TPA: S-methyl-5'-thioinosine phosphorylase [Woeseiaceae bacterium]